MQKLSASNVFGDGLKGVSLPLFPTADVREGDEGHVVTSRCRALKLYHLFFCYEDLSLIVKAIYA